MAELPEGFTIDKPEQGAPPAGFTIDEPRKKEELPKDLSLGRAGVEAVKHIPESAVQFGKNIAQPIIHPIETAESLKNLGAGVLQKLGIMSGNESEKYADAVGQFLKDRYGGYENVKHTLATDPIGLAADVSMLLSGGGTAAARLPGAAGAIGEAAATAGRIADPLTAVGATVKGAGALGRAAAGNYLGHVGERPMAEAFRAGKEGGQAGQEFRSSMRDPAAQFPETVESARKAVEEVGREAGRVYRSGMVEVGKDYHMLDFGKINNAVAKYEGVGKYKGVDLETPMVKATRDQMLGIIDEWKGYAPAQYHTPEGFDALKRKLGYVMQETERGSPAHLVASQIYNSVRETITDQAPAYAKVMKGYEKGKEAVRELEHELTSKPDAPIGPALRKLQSVMRDNVHTAFGHRAEMAQFLVENGSEHLLTRLAGQAFGTWTPRGFGRAVASGDLVAGIGAALLGHPKVLAMTLLTLPMMSPRILGEAAHFAGRIAPSLPGRKTGEALFQTGRVKEEEQTPIVRYDAQGNLIQ